MLSRFILLAGLLGFLLAGCGGDTESTRAAGAKKKKPTAKKSATEKSMVVDADEKSAPDYRYDPLGKRDPFMSPLAMLGPIEDEDSPITPLQRYDVKQFRLNGVITGLKIPSAMVRSPDGKSYILKIGTKIGKNGGRVVRITDDGVSVEEILTDFSGETRVNELMIALPKRKGAR